MILSILEEIISIQMFTKDGVYVAHIDYRKQSLVGQIKFFSKDITNHYAHILWFADFRIKRLI